MWSTIWAISKRPTHKRKLFVPCEAAQDQQYKYVDKQLRGMRMSEQVTGSESERDTEQLRTEEVQDIQI